MTIIIEGRGGEMKLPVSCVFRNIMICKVESVYVLLKAELSGSVTVVGQTTKNRQQGKVELLGQSIDSGMSNFALRLYHNVTFKS